MTYIFKYLCKSDDLLLGLKDRSPGTFLNLCIAFAWGKLEYFAQMRNRSLY